MKKFQLWMVLSKNFIDTLEKIDLIDQNKKENI